jgi:hypothetical protein
MTTAANGNAVRGDADKTRVYHSEELINSVGRIVCNAKEGDRLRIFEKQAAEMFGYVNKGTADATIIGDGLQEIAEANDLIADHGQDKIQQILTDAAAVRLPAAASAETDPKPPPREFPVLAQDAYSGLAGEIVGIIDPHTESDPAALLLNLHAMLGNVIGRRPHYRVKATDHSANIFVLQVGDTAKARKGTGADRVRQLFRYVDPDWANKRVHTGLSSGEGVIWEVRDPITKLTREGKGDDAEIFEQLIDAGVADKRLLILESEMAGALRVMQREGNILSRVLRDAWDRGDLASLTKNSPARATGAYVSIIGHITGTELRANLDRTEMANGFANRFLFACVRRSKLLPFGGSLNDAVVVGLADKIKCVIDAAKRIGRVTFASDAAAGWEAAYPTLSSDRPGLLGALTARAEAQVIRLALLYALWDGSDRITLAHLRPAMAIWEYCAASVEYLFGDLLGEAVSDAILAALRRAPNGLSRTEISAALGRNVAANQIARALNDLALPAPGSWP